MCSTLHRIRGLSLSLAVSSDTGWEPLSLKDMARISPWHSGLKTKTFLFFVIVIIMIAIMMMIIHAFRPPWYVYIKQIGRVYMFFCFFCLACQISDITLSVWNQSAKNRKRWGHWFLLKTTDMRQSSRTVTVPNNLPFQVDNYYKRRRKKNYHQEVVGFSSTYQPLATTGCLNSLRAV